MKWPKHIPSLTAEQKKINDDFMRYWHEVLPKKYGIIDDFNHNYSVKNRPLDFLTTLEIGAGLGTHLNYETLSKEQEKNYIANDIRINMTEKIKQRFPNIRTIVGDCEQGLEFTDNYFDRVLAIHVLEHLSNLPAAIKEIYRIINKNSGNLSVVIPCEGGWAYSFARRISAKRIFEKRYKQNYDIFIKREHINLPKEIIEELEVYFDIIHKTMFPLRVPIINFNLCIGLTLKPKNNINL